MELKVHVVVVEKEECMLTKGERNVLKEIINSMQLDIITFNYLKCLFYMCVCILF